MCGIVAYIGGKQAYPILIKGLHRLEYRGYDSAGVAILNSKLTVYKCKGKVSDLEIFIEHKKNADSKSYSESSEGVRYRTPPRVPSDRWNRNKTINLAINPPKDSDTGPLRESFRTDVIGTKSLMPRGTIGIGHTRWATHGEPNDINAHPHFSQSKNLVIIHNGIIENYASLKKGLQKRGHKFQSNTDTEVLIHLIEDIKHNENIPLEAAVRHALNQVIGAYAIVILSKDNPNQLIAAKKSSPLVIGIGKDEYFVASDATPIVEYTKNVVYLEDEQIAVIPRKGKLGIKTIRNKIKTPYIRTLELELEQLEKGGYPHFMLKEIYEQPRSIRDSMRGRLDAKKGKVNLGGIKDYEQKIINAKRIIFVACGTSWHAGMVGEYLFEDLARIPVEVEYASEFRYSNPIIGEEDVVIAISQSGETADTLAAVELAKAKGATILGICNVVGSTIPRTTHCGSYTHAGPEIGVASTKAFTAQITVLALMALRIAHQRGNISESRYYELINELDAVPLKVEKALKKNEEVKKLAGVFKNVRNFLYLGRGYTFPVALEGALKLKEISYIHAEGYPAAEMKHGPIALIDDNMPVVVIATKGAWYEKVMSNIQEVKARKGKIIAIVTERDKQVKKIADYVIEIPETDEILVPFISVIPLQLLAYHIAVMRGCNIDQPRNLAKSVTVE